MAGYIGSRAAVATSGVERKKTFAITTTTTSLTGLDYTPNHVHVFHNGIRLVDGTDYTATNGTSITLVNAATDGDEVVVVSYGTFSPADTYTKTEADDRYVNASGDTMTGGLNITGSNFANTTYTGTSVNPTGVYTGLTSDGGFTINVRDSGYLQLSTNNTERVRVDSAGRVTMPYQPAWHYTGGTVLSNSNWVVCNPTTAVISNASYSTSTGAFTAPVSGKYFVGVWGLLYPNGSGVWTTGWHKNGATVGHNVQGGPNSANHTHYSNSLVVSLSAGDSIDFRIYAGNDGMNAYTTQWNQFGYLIG